MHFSAFIGESHVFMFAVIVAVGTEIFAAAVLHP